MQCNSLRLAQEKVVIILLQPVSRTGEEEVSKRSFKSKTCFYHPPALQGFLQLPKVPDLFVKVQSDVHFFCRKMFDMKLTEMLALFPTFPRLDWKTVHYVIIYHLKTL